MTQDSEFISFVCCEVNWHSFLNKQFNMNHQFIKVIKASGIFGCQAFSGMLIDHVPFPERNTFVGPGLHEIIAPNMPGKERIHCGSHNGSTG
jgi:hypothetical protein